jgi:5-methylcytosine-specific restriction endonuclease McrA
MHEGEPGINPLFASVLVLNRSYLAIHVVEARRAFTLLCRELAEIIDIEEGVYANYTFETWRLVCEERALCKQPHEDWVRSVHFEMMVPRVVRLLHFDRVPTHRLRFNRRNLFARDGHKCQYCGKTLPMSQLSLDHVLPRSRGGETTWENVVCCCVHCNVKKGGRTPQEARMHLLAPPKRPKHSPLLAHKLKNPKYESWKSFLSGATWAVDVA